MLARALSLTAPRFPARATPQNRRCGASPPAARSGPLAQTGAACRRPILARRAACTPGRKLLRPSWVAAGKSRTAPGWHPDRTQMSCQMARSYVSFAPSSDAFAHVHSSQCHLAQNSSLEGLQNVSVAPHRRIVMHGLWDPNLSFILRQVQEADLSILCATGQSATQVAEVQGALDVDEVPRSH